MGSNVASSINQTHTLELDLLFVFLTDCKQCIGVKNTEYTEYPPTETTTFLTTTNGQHPTTTGYLRQFLKPPFNAM